MLLPILAIGGAALGIWLLTRDEKEDKGAASDLTIKQPDETTLASADIAGGLYGEDGPFAVMINAMTNKDGKRNELDYFAFRTFDTWEKSYSYYKSVKAFFDENSNQWTCTGGVVQIGLIKGVGVHAELKSIKTYTECNGRVMSKSQADPSDLLLELRDLTRDDYSSWPIVSCGVVVPNEQPWYTQWLFDPNAMVGCFHSSIEDKLGQECHAQREYFWYLFNAFTDKRVNDFYRPKGGLLYIHASGFAYKAANGQVYRAGEATAVWDDNDVLPGSDLVRPRLYRSGVLVR